MKRIIVSLLALLAFTNSVFAQDVIQMQKDESGIYTIPCEVNGLKLPFVFDTGASAVSISLTEASFMLKNGYLAHADITGTTNVQTADGKIAENYTINLKELKIGSVTLNNVKALVSSGLDAPLLLGQTVLDQLGHWSFKNSSLVLNDYSSDTTILSLEEIGKMTKFDFNEHAIYTLRGYIQKNNVRAARELLRFGSEFESTDPDVIKAIKILREATPADEPNLTNSVWSNYSSLIMYVLYDLKDAKLAFLYFKEAELKKGLTTRELDDLAYTIMLYSGFGDNSPLDCSINDSIADSFFRQGYYETFTTYGLFLAERRNSPSKAVQIFKKASDKGHIPATIELARCYLDKKGTPHNPQLGLRLLEKVVYSKNEYRIDAICELCSRYYYGEGLEKDFDKVIEYAKLYGREVGGALLKSAYLGLAYWQKKDYRFALQHLRNVDILSTDMSLDRIAAYNGYGRIYSIRDDIFFALGQANENGMGCKVNIDQALEYYTELAKDNPAWGYSMLGDVFLLNELIESNPELAYKYYLLGANNDSGYCCYRLALMNYYGVGTAKSTIKANEYKTKAIELGWSESDFKF